MELSRKVVTRVWFPALLLMLVTFLPYILFQSYAVVKMVSLFAEILGDVGFDPLRMMTAMQDSMGDIIKVSLQVAVLGQVVLLVNLYYAVGVMVRAYESLFGPRRS